MKNFSLSLMVSLALCVLAGCTDDKPAPEPVAETTALKQVEATTGTQTHEQSTLAVVVSLDTYENLEAHAIASGELTRVKNQPTSFEEFICHVLVPERWMLTAASFSSDMNTDWDVVAESNQNRELLSSYGSQHRNFGGARQGKVENGLRLYCITFEYSVIDKPEHAKRVSHTIELTLLDSKTAYESTALCDVNVVSREVLASIRDGTYTLDTDPDFSEHAPRPRQLPPDEAEEGTSQFEREFGRGR